MTTVFPEHPILALYAAEPHLTRKEVAERLGLTRQRIAQLCKKHGLAFASPFAPRPNCEYCGEPMRWRERMHRACRTASLLRPFTCETCGETFHRPERLMRMALNNPRYRTDRPRFCSIECRDHRRGPHETNCSACGVAFEGTPETRYHARKGQRVYCCDDCKPKFYPAEIPCSGCGEMFVPNTRTTYGSWRKGNRVYCSACWAVKRLTHPAKMLAARWGKVTA